MYLFKFDNKYSVIILFLFKSTPFLNIKFEILKYKLKLFASILKTFKNQTKTIFVNI